MVVRRIGVWSAARLYGIIMGALTGALYNLFAGMFGGIELDIQS